MRRGRGSPWCPLCEPNGGESSYVSLLWIGAYCRAGLCKEKQEQ